MKVDKQVQSLRSHVDNLFEIENTGIVDENVDCNAVFEAISEQKFG